MNDAIETITKEINGIPYRIEIHHDEGGYYHHDEFLQDMNQQGVFIAHNGPEFRTIYDKHNLANRSVFWAIQKYQHGAVHYSMSGSRTYPDQRWDVTDPVGFVIPDASTRSKYGHIVRTQGVEAANKWVYEEFNPMLDSYSKICNGEVYGYMVYRGDSEEEYTSCWGIIGLEEVLSVAEDELSTVPLKAVQRIIDSVWTVEYLVKGGKAYVLKLSREDKEGHLLEEKLNQFIPVEDNNRNLTHLSIWDPEKFKEIQYLEVSNSQHIFSY